MKIIEKGVYYITQKPENNVTMLQEFDTKFGWEKTYDRVNSTMGHINPFDFTSRFKSVPSSEVVAKEYVRVVSPENKVKLDNLREKYVQSKSKQNHILKNSKKSFAVSAVLSIITFLLLALYIMQYIKNDDTSVINIKGYLYILSGVVAVIPLVIMYILRVITPNCQSKKHLISAKNILKDDNLIVNEFSINDNITLNMLENTKVINFKGNTFYVPSGINKLSVRELPIYSEENVQDKVRFYKYFYIPSTVKYIEGEFQMTPTNMWPIGMLIFESDDVILSEELQKQITQNMINVVFNIPKASVEKLIKTIYL